MENGVQVVKSKDLTISEGGSLAEAKRQLENMKGTLELVAQAQKDVMEYDVDFGKIPGVDKPCLLQPGAQKLCLLFGLVPDYLVERHELPNGHFRYLSTCVLSTRGGVFAGKCIGSCSSMEKKYRYRNGERTCPKCMKAALIASKDFKTKKPDGYFCFPKKGGCGAKFPLGDASIEKQVVGQIENPDLADIENTVLKIAQKRSLVGASLAATAAGHLFTQDVEDNPELYAKKEGTGQTEEAGELSKEVSESKNGEERQTALPTSGGNRQSKSNTGTRTAKAPVHRAPPPPPPAPEAEAEPDFVQDEERGADTGDGLFRYNITRLAIKEDKYAEAISYLERNGAYYSEVENLWLSEKELERLNSFKAQL